MRLGLHTSKMDLPSTRSSGGCGFPRRLLMRKQVHFGYCVRSQNPAVQTLEVVRRDALNDRIKPLQHCLEWYMPLEPVEKEAIVGRLEPLTRIYYQEFHRLPGCDNLYWKGSHYDQMRKFINWIKNQPIQNSDLSKVKVVFYGHFTCVLIEFQYT